MKIVGFLLSCSCLLSFFSRAQDRLSREHVDLNKEWRFHFSYDVRRDALVQHITLPHTWNARDVFDGTIDYCRTTGVYDRRIVADPSWQGKRVFLYFEGANSVADVFVNGRFVTEHKGGYTAFCVEITGKLLFDKANDLTVYVSNAYRTDVIPLSGDFNVYGGLHRSVSLIITDKNCITPLDDASPGVFIDQKVRGASAVVDVRTELSVGQGEQGLSVSTVIKDASQKKVAGMRSPVSSGTAVRQTLTIPHPHLWNGRKDPYLYHVVVQLIRGDKVIDEVGQPLGLRYYKVDADSGFILNGRYLDLHGFGRHEDVEGRGSALLPSDQEKDMALIMESGANAMRLTHYPHSNYFYDLADRNGLVLWTEIPLVGPGGYKGMGFINSASLKEQIKQMLRELIRQQYNHPSIFFWGLFNELKLDNDDPVPFLHELNALAKAEDPSRLTTCATFLGDDVLNDVSDVMAWNKYFGWYGGRVGDIGVWADGVHRKLPRKPVAISEYGAGANIAQHSSDRYAPHPEGDFHPEEWQTDLHEASWGELCKRRFIWGKFVWAFSDFGSSIRDEGDLKGLNDKGLITYDRGIKKDAFYFYKANWSDTPMVYITGKRNARRTEDIITVKVYTNQPRAMLFVNGESLGSMGRDTLGRVIWTHVRLRPGNNVILVRTDLPGISDSCVWSVSKSYAVVLPTDNERDIIRKAANVVPSARQLRWQQLELTAFFHFGINTFTGRQWGDGKEDITLFNPRELDADQWVSTMKAAGFRQVIITAKHHDGFCLWPSKYSKHCISGTPYKNGQGDVVKEVADACKREGVGFGVYLSPWDRNSPYYGDSIKYNDYFVNQLTELLTNYGRVDEVWFDGANGEGPNGKKQWYDFDRWYKLIRKLQPQAVIAIMGPDVRWVGTESGRGRETEWSVVPVTARSIEEIASNSQRSATVKPGIAGSPRDSLLGSRDKITHAAGLVWYPAETDVSIRPGWFYDPGEDEKVKSPATLMDIYFSSVGRNGVLLLNVPPDKRGLISANDIKALQGWKKDLDKTFGHNMADGATVSCVNGRGMNLLTDGSYESYFTTTGDDTACVIEVDLGRVMGFDVLSLQENIAVGQRIEKFTVDCFTGGVWKKIAEGTTVGYKRLLRFDTVTSDKVRINIQSSRSNPTLSELGLYKLADDR